MFSITSAQQVPFGIPQYIYTVRDLSFESHYVKAGHVFTFIALPSVYTFQCLKITFLALMAFLSMFGKNLHGVQGLAFFSPLEIYPIRIFSSQINRLLGYCYG